MELQTDFNAKLIEEFDRLDPHIKLVTSQACLSQGIKMCFMNLHRQITEDIVNITEVDPPQLAIQYTMLRLQLMLLQDLNQFFEYAGAYYTKQAESDAT
jgi:hypothetical protein